MAFGLLELRPVVDFQMKSSVSAKDSGCLESREVRDDEEQREIIKTYG